MKLPTRTQIAAAAVTLFAAVLVGSSLWSGHKLSKAARAAADAMEAAEAAEARSNDLERAAAEHRKKIEYLEDTLSDLGRIAAKQDEQIKTLKNAAADARNSADRARAVRGVESTAAELCSKLAELGHPCE